MSSPENLLIDIGNTFIKWSRHSVGAGSATSESTQTTGGRMLIEEVSDLGDAFRGQQPPRLIVMSNVAGTKVRNPLLRALEVEQSAFGGVQSSDKRQSNPLLLAAYERHEQAKATKKN